MWSLKPTDRDVLAGEAIEIPCKVSGKPEASIQWSLSSNYIYFSLIIQIYVIKVF